MNYEESWKELEGKLERTYGVFMNLAAKEKRREEKKDNPDLKEWARLSNKAEGVSLALQYMFDSEMEGGNFHGG